MQTLDENLFSSFEPTTTQAWEAQILAALKGADYEKKLVTTTSDGLRRKPFYRAEDLPSWMHNGDAGLVKGKGRSKTAKIRQDFFITDPIKSNTQLLTALKEDVEEIGLWFPTSPTPDALVKLLEGVWIDALPLHLGLSETIPLETAIETLGYVPEQLKGTWLGKTLEDFPFPNLKTAKLDGLTARERGATPVFELAILIGGLSDALASQVVPENLFIHTGIGSDYFSEIAKLRALMQLVPMLFDAYQVPEFAISVTAFSLKRNKTTRDRHTNLLRMTTECMSAIFGGVDAISLPRFDFFDPEGSDLSLRLSRNIQHILRHESHLNRVQDPAAGSYYIEWLTHSLAEKAWGLFQEMEAGGGLAKSSEMVENWIQKADESEKSATSSGKRVLLGTNTFPNLIEKWPTQAADSYALSADLDELRKKAIEENKRPTCTLIRFGSSAMATARGVLAGNMVGCGPFEVIESPLLDDKTAALGYVANAQTDVVVLCSTDEQYDELTVDDLNNLKSATKRVIIAGKSAQEALFLEQGIEFLRMGRGGVPEGLVPSESGTKSLNLTAAIAHWYASC